MLFPYFYQYSRQLFYCLQSVMSEVVHTSPTIGSNVEEVIWKNFHLLMWDIGGQESLRSSWSTYYTNTEVRRLKTIFTYASLVFIITYFLA